MSREPLGDLARTLQQFALRRYGQVALSISFNLLNGDRDTIPVPLDLAAEDRVPSRTGSWAGGDEPAHLSDFQKVYWPGLGEFRLTAKQAAVCRLLWDAMEDGTHEVDQATLLRAADSDCTRLRDLFSRSGAWGKLIVQGLTPGSYRLPETGEGDAE